MELASTLLKNQLQQSTYKEDIKWTKPTGVQSTHSVAAWPWTKQQHVFTHSHLPEPLLSISTCYRLIVLLIPHAEGRDQLFRTSQTNSQTNIQQAKIDTTLHTRTEVDTCGHKWPQVATSGHKWAQVDTNGH